MKRNAAEPLVATEEEQLSSGRELTRGERNYHQRAQDAQLLKRDVQALYTHSTRIEKSLSRVEKRVAALEQRVEELIEELRKWYVKREPTMDERLAAIKAYRARSAAARAEG